MTKKVDATEDLYVVLYWTGGGNAYTSGSIPKSTAAYERRTEGGVEKGLLGEIERNLKAQGYTTEVHSTGMARSILDYRERRAASSFSSAGQSR